MSVDRTDYIIYGWKLPYEIKNDDGVIDLDDDKFLPLIEGQEGEEFTILQDGMNGEYTVFGLVIALAYDDGGWVFQELPMTFDQEEKVLSRYQDLFESEPPIDKPKLFIFSHYH